MMTVTDVLRKLCTWVQDQQPFFHTRYGDGELMCMFQMRKETDKNCDGHFFYPSLSLSLKSTFIEIVRSGIQRLIIGTNNFTHPHESWSIEFAKFLQQNSIGDVPWSVGDFWWSPYEQVEGKDEIIRLCDLLRGQKRTILIGNYKIRDARYCLGADFLEIPETNAWDQAASTLQNCLRMYHPRAVYIWAAGMPGKSLAWEVKRAFPQSSHIDIGHTFDYPFGVVTRGWHLEKDPVGAHHRRFCDEVFNPYVRSFIP